jgi:hypothetical protein
MKNALSLVLSVYTDSENAINPSHPSAARRIEWV